MTKHSFLTIIEVTKGYFLNIILISQTHESEKCQYGDICFLSLYHSNNLGMSSRSSFRVLDNRRKFNYGTNKIGC